MMYHHKTSRQDLQLKTVATPGQRPE